MPMSEQSKPSMQPLESRVLFTAIPFIVDRDPPAVLLGDLNGDGNADVVTAKSITDRDSGRSKGFAVTVALGEGDGTFRKAQIRAYADLQPDAYASVCIGDVDNDGDQDICLAARDAQTGKA